MYQCDRRVPRGEKVSDNILPPRKTHSREITLSKRRDFTALTSASCLCRQIDDNASSFIDLIKGRFRPDAPTSDDDVSIV